MVKTKSGGSAERIANDSAFVRTRENGAEFINSASARKVLQDYVRNMVNTFTKRIALATFQKV